MKKFLLFLAISSLAITNAHAICEYKFDASNEQIAMIGKLLGNQTQTYRFPQQSNSKVSFTLTDSNKTFMALSSVQANVLKNALTNSSVVVGDQILPLTGITAFELKFKVPNILMGKGKLLFFPIMISGKSQDNKQTSILIFYSNNPDETNSLNAFVPVLQHDQSYITPSNLTSPLPVQNTTDGYQRIGIYMNQSTNQVGFIFNSQNYGYIGTFPSKLDNLYFMIPATYGEILNSDQNNDVSIELVTDKSKFTNTFPTGTKDLCGN